MKKDKLHNINKTGFKTPDNYFENFEARLNDRLDSETRIEGIEDSGFSIPDNYFENFDKRIEKQLNEVNDKPVINLVSNKKFYYIAGIAASLILLFAIFINKPESEELSIDMVESYLENQDLDSYDLAELFTDDDILEDDFKVIETNYNEDNLESYLLDNADIEIIIEQ